jgi:bacteriocin-like protein
MTSSKGTGAGLQDRTEHLRADGELTTDELEHVSGGKPSAAPKEAISFNYSHIEWAYTPQKD